MHAIYTETLTLVKSPLVEYPTNNFWAGTLPDE